MNAVAAVSLGVGAVVAGSLLMVRAGVAGARRRLAVEHVLTGPWSGISPPSPGPWADRPATRSVQRLAAHLTGRRHRVDSDERAIVDLAEGLSGALRRGATLPEALTELGLARAELDPTSTDPHRRILSLGVLVGTQVGGSVAEVFDSVAASVRDLCEQRRAVRAATASARTSAGVITALPVIVVSVLSLDGHFRHSAFVTVPGVVALVGAALLELIGWSWMRRLIGSIG